MPLPLAESSCQQQDGNEEEVLIGELAWDSNSDLT